MTYIKIISIMSVVLLSSMTSLSSAQYNNSNTSSGYKKVIERTKFNFKANLESDWSVELEWDNIYTPWEFKYYKVVRSSTNPSPKYPDDWYIKYSGDINFTKYVDYDSKAWTNYYRICRIMQDNNRYCSSVEKIYIWEEYKKTNSKEYYKEKQEVKNTYTNTNYNNLTSNMKKSLNSLVSDFIKRLDNKYDNNEDKIDIINKVIDKLEELASKKPKLKPSIEYLINLLNKYLAKYEEVEWISEINEIFKNF